MSKKDYTHIAVLLDRSGSMESIKADTEGGFKAFLDDQKSQPGRATVELRQFDTQYDVVYPPTPIEDVAPFTLEPRGGTALLDAMSRSIAETASWLKSLPKKERPKNVVFVVITDGEENSSRECTRDQVFAQVKRRTDDDGWVFVYLGANQDAISVGTSLGFSANTSLSYATASTGSTYAVLSDSVTRTRVAGAAAGAFTDEERQTAAGSVPTP